MGRENRNFGFEPVVLEVPLRQPFEDVWEVVEYVTLEPRGEF